MCHRKRACEAGVERHKEARLQVSGEVDRAHGKKHGESFLFEAHRLEHGMTNGDERFKEVQSDTGEDTQEAHLYPCASCGTWVQKGLGMTHAWV